MYNLELTKRENNKSMTSAWVTNELTRREPATLCFRKICCHVFKGEMFYRFLKMILQSIEIFYLSQKKNIYIYIYLLQVWPHLTF